MSVMDKTTLELANAIADVVIAALKRESIIGTAEKQSIGNKTAYAKTEALLYNYNNFKRIVDERMKEIEEIKKHGVPRSVAVKEYVQRGGSPQGIVLEEESVDMAVSNVLRSIEGTVAAINMIDKAMQSIKYDPYYLILEMRYIEGRTQEDIAAHFKCSQVNISKNKSRLIKELSLRLFPNQVVEEMLA